MGPRKNTQARTEPGTDEETVALICRQPDPEPRTQTKTQICEKNLGFRFKNQTLSTLHNIRMATDTEKFKNDYDDKNDDANHDHGDRVDDDYNDDDDDDGNDDVMVTMMMMVMIMMTTITLEMVLTSTTMMMVMRRTFDDWALVQWLARYNSWERSIHHFPFLPRLTLSCRSRGIPRRIDIQSPVYSSLRTVLLLYHVPP